MILFLFVGSAAHAADEGFDLVRGPPPAVRAGQKATVSLSVVPRAGHRLHADAPLLVRLTGDGVRLARPLYQREDAADPRADGPRFEIALTALARGPASIDVHCTFYLCKDARCRPVEAATAWTFQIE